MRKNKFAYESISRKKTEIITLASDSQEARAIAEWVLKTIVPLAMAKELKISPKLLCNNNDEIIFHRLSKPSLT
jgi:hypothetical protein